MCAVKPALQTKPGLPSLAGLAMDAPIAIISHAHPSVSKGGAEIAAYTLYRGLRALDVPAVFIAAVPRQDLPRVTLRSAQERVIPVDPARYGHDLQLGGPAVIEDLVRVLRETGAGLVNFHHFLSFGLNAFHRVREALDLPVFLTLHEFLAICAHHGQMVTRPARALCDNAASERCGSCFPEHGNAAMATRRDLMQTALLGLDGFVAPSRFLIDRFVQWGLPESGFAMIENGLIGFDRPGPLREREADDPLIFAYFGQINPFKGVDTLLDALDLLLAEPGLRPRVRVRVHGNIIGVSPEFEQRLRAAAGPGGVVQFAGPYDNARVRQLMGEADYVMVPSRWWENSPVVIQEAFAASRPVICTGIGGMAEKVEDGVSGYHFRHESAADLARVMRRALAAPETAPTRFPVPGSETDMAQAYLRFFAARTGGRQGEKEQKT
ncbi:glycosyltransferase [Gemmobacter serpentinus]|uniref:glycosyltransferase n=1 Tax=Gemmobacter serpentinus TaxID=2652247 RepID=UPI00124C977E|nr:glycosyltransferase [Gemmobacter serpentinus]